MALWKKSEGYLENSSSGVAKAANSILGCINKSSQQVEVGDYSPSFSTGNDTAGVFLPVLEMAFFQ